MAYTPKYTKPYPDGWQNLPEETTPITAEVLDKIDDVIVSSEKQLKKTTEIYDENDVNFGRKSGTEKGYKSTALGDSNTASGNYSDALGQGNTSSGVSSHAEGSSNTSSGSSSHAEGYYNRSTADYAHSEGYSSEATAMCAHAEGYDTNATGQKSHAEGNGSSASGDCSHAEGTMAEAKGSSSHAEGNTSKAIADNSHAEGFSTKVDSDGNSGHAEGYGSTVTAPAAHAEGNNTKAEGNYSHSEGNNTTAKGNGSHSEGAVTIAQGENSHAEGSYTTSSGSSSHAEGTASQASGSYSHAEGAGTVASGDYSHAEGSGTKAIGSNAHAEGSSTQASGNYSHAEGSASKANGVNSHAEGGATVATGECQHAQGKYNIEDADGIYAHIVGGGTSDTDRKNIHTLDWQGNAVFAGNVTDGNGDSIASLKSDLEAESANSKKAIAELNDKKITKFYANNIGETTLNDSDNGKIADMLIYGKSEQFQGEIELEDGTTVTVPCPDYPQEIKSVVNPVVKVCGKNLLDTSKATFKYGNGKIINGEIYLNGTYDSNYDYYFFDKDNVALDLIKKVNKTVTISCGSFDVGIWKISGTTRGKSIKINPFSDKLISIFVAINSGTYENVKVPVMVEIGDTETDYEPYKEQTATFPYTLNAIPVSSGGNVTIDGQQYIADYVDIENKKLVRMTEKHTISYGYYVDTLTDTKIIVSSQSLNRKNPDRHVICNVGKYVYPLIGLDKLGYISWYGSRMENIAIRVPVSMTLDEFNALGAYAIYELATPTEIDLTDEEVQAFKDLATYYPKTNVFVASDQLDGYTVFNYPISMENGWNYVKQQIGDTRDYIYDMELQTAEAYVNSEYAVTLTELGV